MELMFDDDRPSPTQKARTTDLIEKFKRDIVSFESRLGAALKLTRLNGHSVMNEDGSSVTQCDFLRWLQFCATGVNQP
ncbi:hypothetical protein, partial [Sphingobium sp.]|uniref:hypothetical protein n=1 Tax=Sphingobium sp. TaxID=1912891 RepID=UPI0035C77825